MTALRLVGGAGLGVLLAVTPWDDPALADVLTIHPDGSGDYPTIQAALDGGSPADVVELADGVFRGDGNRDLRLTNVHFVRSASGNAEACVIDCDGSADDPHRGFDFRGGDGVGWIDDITVTGGFAGGAIGNDGGAALMVASAPIFTRCRFVGNHADGDGGAISVVGDTEWLETAWFIDCVFSGNQATNGGGLHIDSYPEVEGCLITGNLAWGTGGGIHAENGFELDMSTVAGNLATGSGGGIHATEVIEMKRTILWGNDAAGPGPEMTVRSDPYGRVSDVRSCVIDLAGVVGLEHVELDNCVALDPLFCGPEPPASAPTVAGDYTIADDSPARPGEVSDQVGALEVACTGVVPTAAASWSSLKDAFREGTVREDTLRERVVRDDAVREGTRHAR